MTEDAGIPVSIASRTPHAGSPRTTPESNASVTRRDRLAGRRQALHDLQHVLLTPGQHALLLGEPGIGLTSTLGVLPSCLEGPRRSALVTIEASDTLATLWTRAAASLGIDAGPGTPGEVAGLLRRLSAGTPVLVAIDDLQLASPSLRSDLAALVGALASPPSRATLVIAAAGWEARRVWPEAGLLTSTLGTCTLSRLDAAEMHELLEQVFAGEGLDSSVDAGRELIEMSAGRPGEAKRLAAAAASAARRRGAKRVEIDHVEDAIREALATSAADLREEYENATIRARRGIFPEILWACAKSPREADGSFTTLAVRDTLQRLLKREVRGLTNQISVLAESTRGQVLEKVSGAPNPRYRFADPRLEPFVLLRGLGDRDLPNVPVKEAARESWLREAA